MSDGFIQVAVDGGGKKLQTFENTINGNLVESEAVTLSNSAGVPLAVSADMALKTSDDYSRRIREQALLVSYAALMSALSGNAGFEIK